MTVIDQLIRSLEATKGDAQAKAVVAAEFLLSALPEAERRLLHAALDAAAVLRWFDPGLMEKVMEVASEEANQRFTELRAMPFVERFPSQERELCNVHESTRLGWRKRLARDHPERFRALSARAAACFTANITSGGRIEWLYHLLCTDPDRGATELESLDREWSSRARPEDRYALATALAELERLELVRGRALVWVRLVRSWTDESRGQTAGLMEAAQTILTLAQSLSDQRAEAEAECLLGDGLVAQGRLPEAQAAFTKDLAISQGLAEQDPSNAGWQRELAVAHSRVGDVLQAQGKLPEAHAAFSQYLAISRRLAEQDPSNAGWQRGLAVAHSRVGDVLQAQGKLPEAQAAFATNLAISQELAERDPSNAGWQRGLAVAHSRVGDVLQAQSKLAEAQAAFAKYLAISQQLTEQNPSNAVWRRELAVALTRLARLELQAGRHAAALPLYEQASRIYLLLVESAPEMVEWAKERQAAESELAQCRARR